MTGGKREGAGRKPLPDFEKSKLIAFRIKLSVLEQIPVEIGLSSFIRQAINEKLERDNE